MFSICKFLGVFKSLYMPACSAVKKRRFSSFSMSGGIAEFGFKHRPVMPPCSKDMRSMMSACVLEKEASDHIVSG